MLEIENGAKKIYELGTLRSKESRFNEQSGNQLIAIKYKRKRKCQKLRYSQVKEEVFTSALLHRPRHIHRNGWFGGWLVGCLLGWLFHSVVRLLSLWVNSKFRFLINRCGWCLPVICLLFVHQLFILPLEKFDVQRGPHKPKMNHYPIRWKLFVSHVPCNRYCGVAPVITMYRCITGLSYYDRFANTVDDKS